MMLTKGIDRYRQRNKWIASLPEKPNGFAGQHLQLPCIVVSRKLKYMERIDGKRDIATNAHTVYPRPLS
jgi:hypothetical protein